MFISGRRKFQSEYKRSASADSVILIREGNDHSRAVHCMSQNGQGFRYDVRLSGSAPYAS